MRTLGFIFIFCVVLPFCAAEDVRPLEIQVLDKATGHPLSDIDVNYGLSAARWDHILGIPIIDPVQYRFLVQKKYISDTNGCVLIPKRKVKLRFYEVVDTESVYINMDVCRQSLKKKDNKNILPIFFAAWDEMLCTPNDMYHGAIIYTSAEPFGSGSYDGVEIKTNKGCIFTFIPREGSLTNISDKVVVELDRKVGR